MKNQLDLNGIVVGVCDVFTCVQQTQLAFINRLSLFVLINGMILNYSNNENKRTA
jgi:hypothetical protein